MGARGRRAASSRLPAAASFFLKESTRNSGGDGGGGTLLHPQPSPASLLTSVLAQPTIPPGLLPSPRFSSPHRTECGGSHSQNSLRGSPAEALHAQSSRAELPRRILGLSWV